MSLEKLFHLKENHTDVKTEVLAGITTFMTMAYILAVNPGILGATGMDSGAVFTATAVSALFATLCMAFMANYPFVLAPGMGLNAYFAYTVVLQMGYSWEMALTAVFAEGIIFILLSLTNVREKIFNAIPMTLKHSVSAGIGLFIAFIGLQNAKIVVDGATLVGLYSFKASVQNGTFSTEGITVLLALIGILITAVLLVKQVKGGILWGILITWLLGIICQFTGLYVPNAEIGYYSLLPDFSAGLSIPSLAPIFMKLDFPIAEFVVIIFAFLFVDIFDTLGTLIGVASKADMLDDEGRLPRIKGALMADAWHHRSDAISSIGALIGIAGARLGFPIMDSIASLVIFVFIVKAAYSIFRDAMDKMVDHSCDEDTENAIRACVRKNKNVRGIDLLQTRIFGNKIYVDIEIALDGTMTLQQAHNIAEEVHDEIENDFPKVKHIMVHVNPEK